MAVYEITNVENTGPTSHEEKKTSSKRFVKLITFILMLPYLIHRKTQERSLCIDKTFLVDTKVRFKHSDDYKLLHTCEKSGLI